MTSMSGVGRAAARWLRRMALGTALVAALAAIAVVAWSRLVTAADPAGVAGLASNDDVIVSRDEWITFRPRDIDATTGLIFYPGGKADPRAYGRILREIAAAGYLVVLTPMPLNLALLAPGRADAVRARYPAIRNWVVGGHSLGGVVACSYAQQHASELVGLILWAAYPAAVDDLSDSGLKVLSIYASLDEQTTPAEISQGRLRLPPDSTYVSITGGDHWNFGHFGPELSTGVISRKTQQAQVRKATLEFLRHVSPSPVIPSAV
jgi:pimeloyl-ACP methyl ester carboxylesterase